MSESSVNDGVFFVESDHPVCEKCVSSLDREERCWECGGEGYVLTEPDDWEYESKETKVCDECRGIPPGWFCPTCNRHWQWNHIQFEETP